MHFLNFDSLSFKILSPFLSVYQQPQIVLSEQLEKLRESNVREIKPRDFSKFYDCFRVK